MPFALSPDQDMIRKMVAEFADAEVKPQAEHVDHAREFPRETLRKMAPLGLLTMLVPAEQGGAGTDTGAFVVAVEEVAARCATTATAMVAANAFGSNIIAKYASEDARARYLPGLTTGDLLPAWALSEPGAGSDLKQVRTVAEKKEGGGYLLTGLKSFVIGGGVADVYIVFANVLGDSAPGLTAFLVPKDAPGLVFGPPERMLSVRGASLSQLFLKGVEVTDADILGAEGDGLTIAMEGLGLARLGVSALSTGIMQASLDASCEYANDRKQFRQPIKNFQAIQWKIADMDVKVRASRLLTYAAAAKRDEGSDFAHDAAAAKLFSGESAKHVTQEAIRVHGGTGFMRDAPLERYNRDGRAMSIFGGTSEMQRAAMAANLLGLE